MSVATLIALGGGALSALFYASTLAGTTGALLLVLMAPLPLYLVGLSQGAMAAFVAGAFGTVLATLLGGLAGLANYAVADALPAWLLVRQALLSRRHPDGRTEWYPAGLLVLGLSLYASVVFLALVAAFAGSDGGLAGELHRLFEGMRQAWGLTAPPQGAERALEMLVALLPGLSAASWLLASAANAALAQGVLLRFRRNLRPSPSLRSFDLPRWLALVLAALGAAGALLDGAAGFVARNLFLTLAMPYFFGGLALIHALLRRGGTQTAGLALLYVMLGMLFVILSWLAIIAIAGLGFIDQMAGLRQRLARPKGGPNDSWE
jgi:hypothetical protein